MPADPTPAPKWRATSLSPQDHFLLDQWGRQMREAFPGDTGGPYLVGSVARAEAVWRDVDVRHLLTDPFLLDGPQPRLRTLNVALTLWGRQVTGLPLDFQFQTPEEFHSYDGERRSAIGIGGVLTSGGAGRMEDPGHG